MAFSWSRISSPGKVRCISSNCVYALNLVRKPSLLRISWCAL